MGVAKKDQERQTYASMYGAQARKDGKGRVVPKFWDEFADAGWAASTVIPPPPEIPSPLAVKWKRRSTNRQSASRLQSETGSSPRHDPGLRIRRGPWRSR